MQSTDFWQNFVNKQVAFRFMRHELQFYLSQSLFSSADVDIGSRFLLRTISKQVELSDINTLLDIGCGVGVLGLSLKKINPSIQLISQDRDALAVTFTMQNGLLNELEDVVTEGGLAFQSVNGQKFDLIVSNLPGKAGQPVLRDMLQQMPAYLSDSGMAAVVIVKPLASLVAETLNEMESEVLLREEASGYEVFHFLGGNIIQSRQAAKEFLSPYFRNKQVFKLDKQKVELRTAWNLPEFDNLAHDTSLAINALKKKTVAGNVLFWNPRQGHLPVYLREQVETFTLAGRDELSLQIAEMNLRENGMGETAVSCQHVPHFLEASGHYDWIIMFPDIDPGVAWEKYLLPHCAKLLASGGKLLCVAKSAYMHRLLQKKRGLHSKFDRKRNGFRAVILQKQ